MDTPQRCPAALTIGSGLVVVSAACYLTFALLHGRQWDGVVAHAPLLWRGWLATLAISTAALVVSVTAGALLVVLLRCPLRPLAWAARGYIELVRGTPLLVQLFIGFYVLADALGVRDRFVAGTLILAMFAAAYLAEIFRAGIESVGASQVQAARAVGFGRAQAYRYVIVPQAVRRVLPATAGQLASLIKDSSLLSVLAVNEFTKAADIINAKTYATFEAYLPVALGYLALTVPISVAAGHLERRFGYET